MTSEQRDAIVSPATGLILFNLTENCLQINSGTPLAPIWPCIIGSNSTTAVLTTLNCAGATHNGTLTSGTAASGVSSVIAYTGGNGGTYTTQTITSTGVTGLTATLTAGTLASGAGTVTYTITGTPAASGTASFAISLGGQSCTFTRTVAFPLAAVVITLDCAGATHNGTLTSGTAASGVSTVISYTGGNGGIYATQTVNSYGVTGLTATLSAGTVANGIGTLTYTITGTPSTAGTAWFPIGLPGNTAACNFSIPVVFPPAAVTTLTCPTQLSGSVLVPGTEVVYGSRFIQVSYTGGNSGPYAAQTITSTGVTGLTATLAANNVNNGTGTLNYFITGTPSDNGLANFEIVFGGQTCTFACPVSIIPPGAVFEQNRLYMIMSAFDQDYLPYTAPITAGTTNTQMADGTNEATTLNIQGSITTTGVEVIIPSLIQGGGYTIPAYSTTITIPADRTEDGISRDLTFSWESQYLSHTSRGLVANIKAVGGTLNLKKLDINAGIGSDGLGILIGQFTYPFSSSGAVTSTISIRCIPAVPDKMFGVSDNNNDATSHAMFYGVVMGPDGNIWLNNNLGAHYANTNHANFNPFQQATNATDHLAYGSLFQWGRSPDGHELITWTNSTTGTPVNGTTTTLSDTPTNALFITATTGVRDWRASTTVDANRWSTTSTNNPCPTGFRMPTRAEFQKIQGTTITNASNALSSTLKFVQTGRFRSSANGALQSTTDAVYLWASQLSSGWPVVAYFASSAASTEQYYSTGYNVRCFRN
jgi:hypothetical protein